MTDILSAQSYLSQGWKTLETLSSFFKFYKSLNDLTAAKLSEFLANVQVADSCKSVKNSMETLISCIQARINAHIEVSE
jgi:hypothetical protein